jgi:hypothetical protein
VLGVTFFLLGTCIARAQGGPPLLTDDPGTPGNRHWEINVGFTFDRSRSALDFETPRIDFNYGLGERIQLKYELPWVVLNPSGQPGRDGLGNSLLGVKWRYVDEEKRGISVSLYPQLEFNNPTTSADRGLVERGTQFLLPIEMARRFGPLDVNWEVGYRFRQQEKDEWLYGLAFGRHLHSRLELLGELHGTVRRDLQEDEMVFDVGGRWQLRGPLVLLFATGRAIRGTGSEKSTWFGYVGMQFNL